MARVHVQPGPMLYIFKLNAIIRVNSEKFDQFILEDFTSPEPEWAGSAQGEGYETHWDDGDPETFITFTNPYQLAELASGVRGY